MRNPWIVGVSMICAIAFIWGSYGSDLAVMASVGDEITVEEISEIEVSSEAVSDSEPVSEADSIELPNNEKLPEESTGERDTSAQPEGAPAPSHPEEMISALPDESTAGGNQPQIEQKLVFAFAKDPVIIPSTLTAETYNEATLKTVTLLDGVSVKDEHGNAVQPWVSDLGGFAASDLASVGKTFSITYAAKHPVSDVVQTAVRGAVVGPVSGRAARAIHLITTFLPNAEDELREILNNVTEETSIYFAGDQLELKDSLIINTGNLTSPTIIHFINLFTTTTIKASNQSSAFANSSRMIQIVGNGEVTLDFTRVTLDGSSKIAGIRVFENANLTLKKAVIMQCSANVNSIDQDYYGGALRLDGSGKIILNNNCLFNNNSAEINGGAVAVMNGATVQSNHIVISQNKARNGGGVYVMQGGLSLNSVQFTSNWATQCGGGIYMEQGDASGYTLKFSSNRADKNGGAAYLKENGNMNVQNNTGFASNIAYGMNKLDGGGAIFTEDKSYSNLITMPDTKFVSNYALVAPYNSTPAEFSHLPDIGYSSVSVTGTHAINNYDINYHDGATSMLKLIKVPTVVDYGTLTIPQALVNQWRPPEDVQYSNMLGAYQDYAIVVQSTAQSWKLRVSIPDLTNTQGERLEQALAYRRDNTSIINDVLFNDQEPNITIDPHRKIYGLQWDLENGDGLLLNTAISPQLATGEFTSTITWSLEAVVQ